MARRATRATPDATRRYGNAPSGDKALWFKTGVIMSQAQVINECMAPYAAAINAWPTDVSGPAPTAKQFAMAVCFAGSQRNRALMQVLPYAMYLRAPVKGGYVGGARFSEYDAVGHLVGFDYKVRKYNVIKRAKIAGWVKYAIAGSRITVTVTDEGKAEFERWLRNEADMLKGTKAQPKAEAKAQPKAEAKADKPKATKPRKVKPVQPTVEAEVPSNPVPAEAEYEQGKAAVHQYVANLLTDEATE